MNFEVGYALFKSANHFVNSCDKANRPTWTWIFFPPDVAELLPDGPHPLHHPDHVEHQDAAQTEANG